RSLPSSLQPFGASWEILDRWSAGPLPAAEPIMPKLAQRFLIWLKLLRRRARARSCDTNLISIKFRRLRTLKVVLRSYLPGPRRKRTRFQGQP
ncbi:MAG: hypothetical protein M0015_01070, partial [Betaproteobacteria bacterium]|nr:hypothetical protein [Betaproteobacteria bacterium]